MKSIDDFGQWPMPAHCTLLNLTTFNFLLQAQSSSIRMAAAAAANNLGSNSSGAPPPPTPRCLPQTPPHSSNAPPTTSAVGSYTPRVSSSMSAGPGSSASQTPVRKMSKDMIRQEPVPKVHAGHVPKPVARLSLRAKVCASTHRINHFSLSR